MPALGTLPLMSIVPLPEIPDFSRVAHDLGTPLTAMLGHLQLLGREQLSAAGVHRLEIVEAQVRRMSRLIEQQLLTQRGSFRRVDRARDHDGTVDAHDVIRRVLGELEVVLERCGIGVSVSSAPRIGRLPGDADALHRVLVNIITNAADAMPNGGRIRVIVRPINPPATPVASVAIDVIDTGSGIPRHLHARIFEPRFTTKGSDGGSGLGLAICREIAEAHGGRIEISSEVGRGTTVRLLLPRVRVTERTS